MGKSLFRPNRSLATMTAQLVKYVEKKQANSNYSSNGPTTKTPRVDPTQKFGESTRAPLPGNVSRKAKLVAEFRQKQAQVGPAQEWSRPEFKLDGLTRVPLSEVVSDCMKKWYKETLNEARKGDYGSQVLVSQMYYNGYGCPKSSSRGYRWYEKATIDKTRRGKDHVWQIRHKHPGYVRSDSDSEDPQ